MHARQHRIPGNGYRSGSVGMGLDGAPHRGHGFYNSDYRSFNRVGFGRGQAHPKSYQQQPPPPPQPPQKVDIFMEAGRLATEYMVSQGLLPPSTLSAKWQNGGLKKEFRSQEGDNLEGRTSALSRLGTTGSDVGSVRRRNPDEFETRNYFKGRKRGGSHHGFESDLAQDYGRKRSWSGRDRAGFVWEGGGDDNFSDRNQEELQGAEDVGNILPGCSSVESLPKGEEIGDAESGKDKLDNSEEMDSKVTISNVLKDIPNDNDWPPSKVDGELTNSSSVNNETKDATSNDGNEKLVALGDSPIRQFSPEAASSNKNDTDLLALCKFAKMPTKTRSSLTYSRNSKFDCVPNNAENNSDSGTQVGSEVLVKDTSLEISPLVVQSDKPNHTEDHDLETSRGLSVQSVENVGDLSPSSYSVELGKCTRSSSLHDGGFMHEDNAVAGEGLPSLETSGIMNVERGETRTNGDSDSREGTKKPKEWISSMAGMADEYFHLSCLSNSKGYSQEEGPLPKENTNLTNPESGMLNASQFPGSEASVDYALEKQLSPSSFKTCDLNLMEVCDMNESHHGDPMLIYQSIPDTKREATPIEVDLSVSNSDLCGAYSMRTSNGKDIEVIDLENDSAPEDKGFANLRRKIEPVFPGLEGFSNNATNDSDIPDVDDNYDGLLLSEYLSSFPNCASIPEDNNPMQNEMGLRNCEGTLAVDDDLIYTSLGEISLSFKGDASYSSFTDI